MNCPHCSGNNSLPRVPTDEGFSLPTGGPLLQQATQRAFFDGKKWVNWTGEEDPVRMCSECKRIYVICDDGRLKEMTPQEREAERAHAFSPGEADL